jgi:hypothetical protein
MVYKKSNQNTRALNPATQEILNDLKRQYGDMIGDPRDTYISLTNPPGSAGHVTSEDADEHGAVKAIRVNPETERGALKNLNVGRIRSIKETLKRIKSGLDSIDNTDDNFKEDLVTLLNAYVTLGGLSAHELGHSKPTLKGEEFAEEDVAQREQKKMEDIILKDRLNELHPSVRDFIEVRSKITTDFIKKVSGVANKLDEVGRSDLADKVDYALNNIIRSGAIL